MSNGKGVQDWRQNGFVYKNGLTAKGIDGKGWLVGAIPCGCPF
jgi:hypothetical protein